MRRTLYISEAKRTDEHPPYKYTVPYILYDRRKWREDTVYCTDLSELETKWRKRGFAIK